MKLRVSSRTIAHRLGLGRLSVVEGVFLGSLGILALYVADAAIEGFRWGGPASPLLALVGLVALLACSLLVVRRGRVARINAGRSIQR